jgi:hypothetical protein
MHHPLIRIRRSIVLSAVAALTALGVVMSAAAAEVQLFKIVTPKDEMFVGLTSDDIAHLGSGAAVELLSKKIAADGQMTIWQYAVKHDKDGSLVFGPLAKVSVFAAGVVRIEPYAPAYNVLAPAP